MNKNDYIIRLETKKDYYEVENLAREAFWNLSFSVLMAVQVFSGHFRSLQSRKIEVLKGKTSKTPENTMFLKIRKKVRFGR